MTFIPEQHEAIRRGYRDEHRAEGRERRHGASPQPERHWGIGHGGAIGHRGRGGHGGHTGHGGRGERGGEGGGDGGGERRGRDGSGRRVLGRGELPLVILALLNEAPRHGYEIIRCIEARCMGAYSPSAGVIYPTLTMLEEQELTQADPTSEVGKRRYAITEAGRRYINEQHSAIQDAFARMDYVARMRARAALPDRVAQAMEALKVALLRHGANWDDPQDIERCAVILETAATALGSAHSQASQATTSASTSGSSPDSTSGLTPDAAPDIGQHP